MRGVGGGPSGRPYHASYGQRLLSLRRLCVRNPSAVASATLSIRQRHQPVDLLFINLSNAVNGDKHPCRLVRIEKVG